MEAKLREIGNLIFGEGGSMSYISNAQRADMIRLLHELLAHLSRGDVGTLDGKPQNAPPIGEG
jgi:hypothetical protein